MGLQPDQSQVIAGPGLIYLAPLGTALPTLTGAAPVWGAGWYQAGYTDAGIDAINTAVREYAAEKKIDITDADGWTRAFEGARAAKPEIFARK